MRSRPGVGELRWSERKRQWRRWSGRRWAGAIYAVEPAHLRSPQPFELRVPLGDDVRERMLRKAVAAEVLRGATTVHQERLAAVLSYPRPVNHLGHAVLSLLTGGVWAVVWIVMAVSRRDDRARIDIDRWGNVWPSFSTR